LDLSVALLQDNRPAFAKCGLIAYPQGIFPKTAGCQANAALARFSLIRRLHQQNRKELNMSMVAEREMEHIGKTKGAENHDNGLLD
jgi:hypothetical protein